MLLCILPIAGLFGQLDDGQVYYIQQYKDIAIREMLRTGIPASITLAQGLLESDAGRSELARRANNQFGIKCGDKSCRQGRRSTWLLNAIPSGDRCNSTKWAKARRSMMWHSSTDYE